MKKGFFVNCIFMAALSLVLAGAQNVLAQKNSYNWCEGLSGATFGLCNAYCNAMDCASEDHQPSDTACASVLGNYFKKTGELPPCEYGAPCTDNDGDDYYAEEGCGTDVDCLDTDSDVNPGAPETCDDLVDNNCDGQVDEGCTPTSNTPAGEDVNITVSGFDLLFDNVTAGGETTVSVSTSGPSPPAGFLLFGSYYDISTTAQFTGMVEICFDYDDTGLSALEEAALRLWHYNVNTSQWEDTTTVLDSANNRICGETDNLSPFSLGFSSFVGNWTVAMDYFCDGYSEYTLTWEINGDGIFRALLPNGQIQVGTWAWVTPGSTFTVNTIPGWISGNIIGGSYTGTSGCVQYSGSRSL